MKPKIAHPRQKPTNASSEAATISGASRTQAAGWKPTRNNNDGGSGQGGADPLRETLGWSGNKLDVPDPGRQHLH